MSQATNIIPLKIAEAPCNDNSQIAADLRMLADRVESGGYGDTRMFVLVLDTNEGVQRYSNGFAGMCKIDVVGILTLAAHKCMDNV